ncbi:MAG: hypothetical protein A3F13_07340 [Gammaproteobacteria bacterium RIFCSPHIGHO2_12_FULL_40_19]|nr:MAG: hypothetical protein A3F13_07340 [Gammaproteobacteria bacterium RIFCSPHIGHO2_12_FULL_40_19]
MGKIEKLLQKMRHNPRDWRIEDIQTIAKRYKIDYRQPGTSHVTFRFTNGEKLTVPAHKPVKPIYIQKFIDLLNTQIGGINEE